MSLRCLIIDDEPLAHKVIEEYAKAVPFLEIVAHSYLATEALSVLHEQSIELLFLDIQMPRLQGLDFLRTVSKKPLVIITSAYEEYALESFELDVCDYLLKPYRFERFLKAVNKAQEMHSLKNQQPVFSKSKEETAQVSQTDTNSQQLFIKSDKRLIQIDLPDIFHLENYGNYVKVWLEESYHLTPGTLTHFESLLPSDQFFRVHKSFIVHKKHIDYIEGNHLKLRNGQEIPIGKQYRPAIRDAFR